MRLAVFASGGGSNLGAVLDAIDEDRLDALVVLVVTDREGIGALERAEAREIPTVVLPPAASGETGEWSADLIDTLARYEVGAVALAGYLRRIPAPVVHAYRHRILNVHPSLLPAFGGPGMFGSRVHTAVLEYGAQFTGATVHLVDDEFDTGPVVLQQTVEVYENDTPEALAARVLKVEHEIFPLALSLLASGRLNVEGRLVRIEHP